MALTKAGLQVTSHQDRVQRIARYTWINSEGDEVPLLSENEVYNFTIPRGTLTPEEREVINHYVVATTFPAGGET